MPSTKKHLFRDSPYYDKQKLTMSLFGTKYNEADVDYYHEKADIWSNKGKGNLKIDWLATIKNWMCDALKDGKLVYKIHKELDKTVAEIQNNLTTTMTNWQKEEETPVKQAPQPPKSQPIPFPMDLQPYWEECQEKARNGVNPIISASLYDWLLQTGQLSLSPQEIKEVAARAKENYMASIEHGGTPQEKHIFRKLSQEGWENNYDLFVSIGTKAKILAAKDFLYQSIQPIKA